jgi:hypothetical protein
MQKICFLVHNSLRTRLWNNQRRLFKQKTLRGPLIHHLLPYPSKSPHRHFPKISYKQLFIHS